jgi:phytol kinase
MPVVLTVLTVFALLFINEVWWQISRIHGELNRKFVHITVGSFVAFWPFFLTWNHIRYLSLAFLVFAVLSKNLKIFTAIHSVKRFTWGEICFALAVGVTTFITHDKWIYMAALLQMSLADGLAAIIGTRYGRKTKYEFLGHAKSLVGTLAFFAVSILILLAFAHLSGTTLGIIFMIEMALGATLIENVGVRGLDNLLVPIFIAFFLANH